MRKITFRPEATNSERAKEIKENISIMGVVDLNINGVKYPDTQIKIITMDLKNGGLAYEIYNPWLKKWSYMAKSSKGLFLKDLKELRIETKNNDDVEAEK